MTASNRVHQLCLIVAASVAALHSSCSKASNPAPRATTIPAQKTDANGAVSVDLSQWVKPPTGQTNFFLVLSGGGTMTGSTYTNSFDTVGRKTIKMQVFTTGDSTKFEFIVDVVMAEEAVIQAGTGLVLLDRNSVQNVTTPVAAGKFYTPNFITVSNSQGYVDTFKGALPRGVVIYERVFGGQTDLFLFNPNSPATTRLGNDPDNATDEKFAGKTTDHRVVFTSGTAADPDLFIHNTNTGLTREISAVKDSLERNAFVDANDIVYFERGPSGQRDILTYDPSKDELATVSANAANEVIAAVVNGGGVVFTRDNGAGDVDLWFYKAGIGLVQVAADVATAGFQAGTLTYNASAPNGAVIFTHNVSPTDVDLYYWSSATQTTTVVAANAGVLDRYEAVTSNNKIIYTHEVTPTDWDVRARAIGGADVDMSASADQDFFQTITSLNDVIILRGTALGAWDDSAGGPVGIDFGAVISDVRALPNGNVIFKKVGTGLRRWLSGGGVASVSIAGSWAGNMGDGNFAVTQTATAQEDLFHWNEAIDGTVPVSADPADERFVVATTSSSSFVFSRRAASGAYELWIWDAGNGARQLSNTGLTHTLVGTFKLDNSK